MKKIFIVFLLLILNFISSIAFAENLRFVGKDTEGLNHYLRTDTLKEVTVYDKDNPYDYNTRGMYYEEVTIENGAKSYMGYIFAFLQLSENIYSTKIIKGEVYAKILFFQKLSRKKKLVCRISSCGNAFAVSYDLLAYLQRQPV